MSCGHCSGKPKKERYSCESCGATSNKPKNCCGKPMKKQK